MILFQACFSWRRYFHICCLRENISKHFNLLNLSFFFFYLFMWFLCEKGRNPVKGLLMFFSSGAILTVWEQKQKHMNRNFIRWYCFYALRQVNQRKHKQKVKSEIRSSSDTSILIFIISVFQHFFSIFLCMLLMNYGSINFYRWRQEMFYPASVYEDEFKTVL